MGEDYKYPISLLRERLRRLHCFELRHLQEKTPPNDYLSCRRSLLQGIRELEALLQGQIVIQHRSGSQPSQPS